MFELIGLILSKISFFFLSVNANFSFPPPLNEKEELLLFKKMKNGDLKAREKLIEHNLRLVVHIVKKYYANNKEQEDLISIGTIGLIKAVDSYNICNGTRFATYAGKCLQNEILMYFRNQKKLALETSLNESVDVDKEGNALTYLDIIYVDDDIADTIDIKMKTELIKKAINEILLEREKQIIVLRFGLTKNGKIYTQREVSQTLGISRSYVSRIEKSAIEKIRRYIKNGGRNISNIKNNLK